MKCDAPFRAFIAIGISEEVRRKLVLLQESLRGTGGHVGWVKPLNIHLTLVFLGDINNETSSAVCRAMDSTAASCKPFSCEVKGLGYFGRRHSPKVVWADIKAGAVELVALHSRLCAALQAGGAGLNEKEFVPHLTIGRVRSNRNALELVKAIDAEKDVVSGQFDAANLLLIKSDLSENGPVYTVVHQSGFSLTNQAG